MFESINLSRDHLSMEIGRSWVVSSPQLGDIKAVYTCMYIYIYIERERDVDVDVEIEIEIEIERESE